MLPLIINYATLISYIAFSTNLLLQIFLVYRRKSSLDISWKGLTFSLIGSLVILLKFLTLNDIYLILGQIVFSITVATYLTMVIYYKRPKE